MCRLRSDLARGGCGERTARAREARAWHGTATDRGPASHRSRCADAGVGPWDRAGAVGAGMAELSEGKRSKCEWAAGRPQGRKPELVREARPACRAQPWLRSDRRTWTSMRDRRCILGWRWAGDWSAYGCTRGRVSLGGCVMLLTSPSVPQSDCEPRRNVQRGPPYTGYQCVRTACGGIHSERLCGASRARR